MKLELTIYVAASLLTMLALLWQLLVEPTCDLVLSAVSKKKLDR